MPWTTPRTWTDGEGVTAAIYNAHVRDNLTATSHILAYKSANQTVNNSTTFVNDTALLFAVGTGETWSVQFVIAYTSNTTADFAFDIQWPSVTTGGINTVSDGTGGATIYDTEVDLSTPASFLSVPGRTTESLCQVYGVVTSGSAGDAQFKWAQATANASNTTVNAGSCILGMRLA